MANCGEKPRLLDGAVAGPQFLEADVSPTCKFIGRRDRLARRKLPGWFTVPLCWAATTALVLIGAAFGYDYIRLEKPWNFLESLARIDGQNYKLVADEGYSYLPGVGSSVAFFPAYPLAARWLARVTGIATVPAQLIVSNAFGLAAFVLAAAFLRRRVVGLRRPWSDSATADTTRRTGGGGLAGGGERTLSSASSYALLAMGLLPTTFFFRVAYTESMFLCLAILALYAIACDWPVLSVALVAGLATAVRPVGVALLVPLCWYVWKQSRSRSQAVRRLAYIVPLGCWGLLAYVGFQYWKFHQPFAFALTQTYHRMRPMATSTEKWLSLLSWEPIRDTYDRSSPGYWQALNPAPSRLFSLEFANPIYFVGTAALIALGAWRRWLTSYEFLLAVPLLAIPYFTRAYEMRMLSQARFAAVVFPVYIVLGHLLARLPLVVAGALLALSGLMMGIYSALFAAGYPFL